MKYQEVYPGVDLLYYGNQRQLEYDFVIQPGADPRQIELSFEGTKRLRLDADGNFRDFSGNAYVVGTTGSNDFPTTPGAYQTISRGSSNALVTKVNGGGSALGHSTYLGGSNNNGGSGIAVTAKSSVLDG